MELHVWPGDWGIPSVDHQCLAAMAYCKFAGAPVNMTKMYSPWKSPTGTFPVLKNDAVTESKLTDIFNYLRKQNLGIDHELSVKQSADIAAFTAMMEERLLPALLQLWWVDSKNYTELTRPWWGKNLSFPFSLYVPMQRQKQNSSRLYQNKWEEVATEQDTENKIYKDAKECMNLLSTKLADKDYFFGKTPSSLDAVVFGYLVPILKTPFPNPAIQAHLKACPNLCSFCNKILTAYFPLTPKETEELKKQEEEQHQDTNSEEFPNKKRNIILSGLFAFVAMVTYALASGIVQIDIQDQDSVYHDPATDSHAPQLPDFVKFDDDDDDQQEQ